MPRRRGSGGGAPRVEKPTVFLSHSSTDAEVLGRLKQLLVSKTGGTVTFFLSSDGQSIPFGTNWVAAIEDALDGAAIMFVFLTSASLRSPWVPFEAGYAYGKIRKVTPIGFGVDLATVRPPLSLLQGFNFHGGAGVSNIIRIINTEFSYQFDENVSEQEAALVGPSVETSDPVFGEYRQWLDEIKGQIGAQSADFMAAAKAVLNSALPEGASQGPQNEYTFQGLWIAIHGNELSFRLDPLAPDEVRTLLAKVLDSSVPNGRPIDVTVSLAAGIAAEGRRHSMAARLVGPDFGFADTGGANFRFRDVMVRLVQQSFPASAVGGHTFWKPGRVYVELYLTPSQLFTFGLADLLNALFKSGVLKVEPASL